MEPHQGGIFGLDRVDIWDYPTDAVREALLNAVVHRDYSFNSPTLISIFEDRIELVTVGGLVKGVSMDDVLLGVSVLRNEHLANVFYRLKLIEAYGTGILKITDCYEDYIDKPVFLQQTMHLDYAAQYKLSKGSAVYAGSFRHSGHRCRSGGR